jgi:hypothetical protein
MKYFVLIYDQQKQRLLSLQRFDGAQDAALASRFEAELQHRGDPSVEVVVLSAESEDGLHSTHARYFKSVRELAAAG